MSIQFYDQGVLTINGVSSPVTDVSVSFDDDARPAMPAPIVTPLVVSCESEMDPAAFKAFMDMMLANLPGNCGGPIEPCGEFFGIRPPRWLRLWQRRHEKAAAKRTKMRAARYAARWEQAHLRGGK